MSATAIAKVFVRSANNYDGDAVSLLSGLECKDPSRTIQSSKAEADINTIVKNFGLTGKVMAHERPPLTEDFDRAIDFRELLDLQNAATKSFMSQPAEVRKRFGNDPVEFVDFCSDPANIADMRKMGLALPEVIPEVVVPMKVEIVNGQESKSGG